MYSLKKSFLLPNSSNKNPVILYPSSILTFFLVDIKQLINTQKTRHLAISERESELQFLNSLAL